MVCHYPSFFNILLELGLIELNLDRVDVLTTLEAEFVPFPALCLDLLGEVNPLAASGTTFWIGLLYYLTGDVLGYRLCVHGGHRSDVMIGGLGRQPGHTPGEPVTLGSELFTVATDAVDLILVSGTSRTVQRLLAISCKSIIIKQNSS